jgi:hypothetical protein
MMREITNQLLRGLTYKELSSILADQVRPRIRVANAGGGGG